MLSTRYNLMTIFHLFSLGVEKPTKCTNAFFFVYTIAFTSPPTYSVLQYEMFVKSKTIVLGHEVVAERKVSLSREKYSIKTNTFWLSLNTRCAIVMQNAAEQRLSWKSGLGIH